MTITFVDDSGQSVAGARVLALAHNGTYVDAVAGSGGVASLQLPARRLVTLYAAHSTTAAVLVADHDPANDLDVVLPRAARGGSLIFEAGSGHIPGLAGRLSPIGDRSGGMDRYYLYAENISINDQPEQPYSFTPGQPLMLEDAHGNRAVVTILRDFPIGDVPFAERSADGRDLRRSRPERQPHGLSPYGDGLPDGSGVPAIDLSTTKFDG